MPTYDYACPKCGHRFELFHSIRDETPKKCPKCKARAKRVPAAGGGLLFKGSGFYITDYRSESYRKAAKNESGGGAGESAKTSGGSKSDTGSKPGGKPSPGGKTPAGGGSTSS